MTTYIFLDASGDTLESGLYDEEGYAIARGEELSRFNGYDVTVARRVARVVMTPTTHLD